MRFDFFGKLISTWPLSASALLFGCQQASVLQAQAVKPIPVFYGEDTSLGPFYWIRGLCGGSDLRKVDSFTIMSGDVSNLEFRIKRGLKVRPRQCPSETVPGADILVREKKPVAVPTLVTISFVVHYVTWEWSYTTSSHTVELILEPAGKEIK